MSDDLDMNKIISEFANAEVDATFESVWGKVSETTDRFKLLFKKTYSKYLTSVKDKYSKTKTFFSRTDPVDLSLAYVHLGISGVANTIKPADFTTLRKTTRFSVITGNAGSGKTLLMKYLFLARVFAK